jgi:hypothetical protein
MTNNDSLGILGVASNDNTINEWNESTEVERLTPAANDETQIL